MKELKTSQDVSFLLPVLGVVLDYITRTMLLPPLRPFSPVRNAQVVIEVEEIELSEFVKTQTASVT